MAIANTPVTARWLSATTGYSPHAITTALVLLEELQLATSDSHRSNWRLTHGARQLPLGLDQLEGPDREKRDSDPTTATTAAIEENNGIREAAAEEAVPDREKRDSNRENRDPRNSTIQDERTRGALIALRAAGIGEPTASSLAAMGHVTAEYVIAHAEKASAEGISSGLLVHRIRSADPMPANSVFDDELERRKYVTGRYSDFVQH